MELLQLGGYLDEIPQSSEKAPAGVAELDGAGTRKKRERNSSMALDWDALRLHAGGLKKGAPDN